MQPKWRQHLPKIANRFQSLLDEALDQENHFRRGHDLTIKWRLIGYHEGSRALRDMVGLRCGPGQDHRSGAIH